jgi:hypothetical protein
MEDIDFERTPLQRGAKSRGSKVSNNAKRLASSASDASKPSNITKPELSLRLSRKGA